MPKNNTVQNPKAEDDKSKDVDPKPVKSPDFMPPEIIPDLGSTPDPEPIKDPGPIDNPTWSK